jgi:DNA-binding NarL/FixJ family response regulator
MVTSMMLSPNKRNPDRLSPRQLQVLHCLARGLSNKATAKEMGITPDTVKEYVRHIFVRTGITSRKQAWTVLTKGGSNA